MRHFALLLVAVLFLVTYPDSANSAIYKWVDANGVITFKDTPPPEGTKVEVVNTSSSAPIGRETTQKAGTTAVAARKEHKVEIFTTDWCPYCKLAIDYLKANKIPFTEYDIEKDSSAERRKNELDTKPGVPFAIINGNKVHGFNPLVYKDALGMK